MTGRCDWVPARLHRPPPRPAPTTVVACARPAIYFYFYFYFYFSASHIDPPPPPPLSRALSMRRYVALACPGLWCRRYEGPWVRGVPHGRGRLTTAAGPIESEWVDGVARSGPAGRAVSAGPSAAPTLDTPAASAVGHTQGRPHALPSGTGGAALDLATAPATAPATAHATDATDRSRVTVGSVGAGASLAAEIMATPEA